MKLTRLREDADAARANQQADDDEDDSPEDLPPEESENSGHHQYYRENPKNEFHVPLNTRSGYTGNLTGRRTQQGGKRYMPA
ncbi:hypothetical protein GCM10027290_42600 [Micromonospora sonneratiae]